jgi:hypothetical protein
MALTLLVEAYHHNNDISGAESAVQNIWADIRSIYQAGGYPIDTDQVISYVPDQSVWTRNPVCVTAPWNASDYNDHLGDSDPVSAALAINALWALSPQDYAKNVAIAKADKSGRIPGAKAGAVEPNAGNLGGVNPPAYNFKTGDSVCGFLWYVYSSDPGTFIPIGVKNAKYPSAALYSGPGDPDSVWHSPTQNDLNQLWSHQGSQSPKDYLNANGFTIPAKGVGGLDQWAAQALEGGWDNGWFDTDSGTYVCLFQAQCQTGSWLSWEMISQPQCYLGSGSYKGLATHCDTDWMNSVWCPNPPPPVTTTGATVTTTSGQPVTCSSTPVGPSTPASSASTGTGSAPTTG